MRIRLLLNRLGYFKYTIHNLIAHPLMEILHLIGLTKYGNVIHDMTLPISEKEVNHGQENNSITN